MGSAEILTSVARNVIDISLVAYLIYRGLLIIKGTRAAPMMWGLTILVVLYFLAQPLGLVSLGWILSNFLSSIILVVIVLFQDEIRRGLTKVGLQPLFRRGGKPVFEKTIEDISLVATKLARDKIGALIVIQRDVGLEDFVEDSVILDALVNRKLLYTLFVKDSPLHDGAVLIESDRIKAAGCVLPLSFNPDLDPNLGTRHRAGLGISEQSDAVVVVVSEETGAISLVHEGRMFRNLDGVHLKELIVRYMTNGASHEDESEPAGGSDEK